MKTVRHLTILLVIAATCCGFAQSDPLDHWTRRDAPGFTNDLSAITYGNGVWVVLSSNLFLRSSNLVDWAIVEPATPDRLADVAFEGGTLVAVGFNERILTSRDGNNWSSRHFFSGAYPAQSVAYGNGRFVCLVPFNGLGGFNLGVLTSTDGIEWNPTYTSTVGLYGDVTYGNGLFVAAGWDAGEFGGDRFPALATSPDGTNWTRRSFRSPLLNTELSAVAYGNGTFVSTGASGQFVTSRDGTNWISPSGVASVESLTYGQGQFLAVGWDSAVFNSADGARWTWRFADTNVAALHDVAYHNGTFVAVGSGGAILQSDTIITLELKSASPPQLTLSGMEGRSHRIQCLDQLQPTNQWKELATLVLTNSPVTWTDTSWSNAATRFYRVVLVPWWAGRSAGKVINDACDQQAPWPIAACLHMRPFVALCEECFAARQRVECGSFHPPQ